jgi:hypothetical protein
MITSSINLSHLQLPDLHLEGRMQIGFFDVSPRRREPTTIQYLPSHVLFHLALHIGFVQHPWRPLVSPKFLSLSLPVPRFGA